jgi:hypothetical protein
VLSSNTYSQNFEALTSQIFFNIDIKNLDTTILSDFNSKPGLTLKKDTGWTVYPPTDNDGSFLPFYIFSFSKHPYFLFDFKSGGVMVMTTKESDKVVGMTLSLSFKSKLTLDSTYNNIKKLYSKYSSKIIKRPNIGGPFEVTKYLSKNGPHYVIVTKGESDNKPYIHIAYDYQGYEW